MELDETIDSRDTLRQRREFAEVDATVPFTQDHQDYLATTEQKVDVLRTQLAATQSRCVGTVVLTSGVVVENNRLRDWVLISLDKARFPDTQRVTNVSFPQSPTITKAPLLTKYCRDGLNIA